MNLLDLFTGIGGFSLGLEQAGIKTAAMCEIDPYCRAVLEKHWPGAYIHDDIRTLTAESLRRAGVTGVRILAGGFPCQDLSVAGKRAGLEGARSGLWEEYRRLICELRPEVVVVENVTGLLSLGFGTVLGDLAALGYDALWDCIPAAAVGAPHRRDRVWIIAYANSGQRDRPEFEVRPGRDATGAVRQDVADTDGIGQQRSGQSEHAREQSAPGHQPDGRRARGRRDRPAVADTDRRRPEAQGLGGIDGATDRDREAGEPGGGREDVAHAERPGLEVGEGKRGVRKRAKRADQGAKPVVGGLERRQGDVPDADHPERERSLEHGHAPGSAGPADGRGRGVEPGLGRVADGVSDWVDPSAWLQEPEEVPRIGLGIENRANRLKALGNSIVPQIAAMLGRVIMDALSGASGANRQDSAE